jgi:RimJ/RimL family protein N-acetyltransferase
MLGEKDCWGKGYGVEAIGLIAAHGFLMLNLNRIWLMVLDTNHRAIRAYVKAGFSKEGILRQNVFLGGGYHDTVVMGLLRSDWQAMEHHAPQTG